MLKMFENQKRMLNGHYIFTKAAILLWYLDLKYCTTSSGFSFLFSKRKTGSGQLNLFQITAFLFPRSVYNVCSITCERPALCGLWYLTCFSCCNKAPILISLVICCSGCLSLAVTALRWHIDPALQHPLHYHGPLIDCNPQQCQYCLQFSHIFWWSH